MMDHRDDPQADVAVQYGPAHTVEFEPASRLREWSGGRASYQVNSLHGQGIARLAERLQVEARATDGLVEAVSVRDAVDFAWAVQWHPEWRAAEDELSRTLFTQFGLAARQRQSQRK
jgi:putative glutamine amidotransferase